MRLFIELNLLEKHSWLCFTFLPVWFENKIKEPIFVLACNGEFWRGI